MATASSASSLSPKSSAPFASSATTAFSGKEVSGQPGPSLTTAHLPATCDAFVVESACQVPTALTAQSNAVAYNTGTDGPKPDTTRLRSRKRYRALALPEHRGAKKDPQLLKAVEDAAPERWGCNIQTFGVNGLSDDAFRQRRKLRHMLRREGLYDIVGRKGERLALAERRNPPAAPPIITSPGGLPSITLNHIIPASIDSSLWDENGAFVPEVHITLPNGKAPDTVLPSSAPWVEEPPNLAFHPWGLGQSDATFSGNNVEEARSSLLQLPLNDTSLAIGPHIPEDISVSSPSAAPPASGEFAAINLLKSGDGALFGRAASWAPGAGDPLDLASAVPVPEEAPGRFDSFAERPIAEFELTQAEVNRFFNDLSMGTLSETHVVDLQAQTGSQSAEQQLHQTEQLQESLWASQPEEHGQQQQAPQNWSAQLPQQAWDSQPLPLTGQQGHGQEQQMPLFPATVPPQYPAHGPLFAMPQQPPLWFDPSLTATENILRAPFPPQQLSSCYNTWTDPNCPWDIYIYFTINGQGWWHSVWSGQCRSAASVPTFQPPQPPVQPPRGPRGGHLRFTGRARARVSAPVNSGSAPVSLSPAVANAQGNGLLAAGFGGSAPVMMQEQPSEQTLVDPALLATLNRPVEQVFQAMMSGALQGSPDLTWQ